MMHDPLLEARTRVQRDWYVDGLTEIASGIVQMLAAGAIFLISIHSSSPWHSPLTLLYFLVYCAFALLQQRILSTIRERITYFRTGYVSYRETGKKRRLTAVAVAALLPFVGGALAFRFCGRHVTWDLEHWLRALPALMGIVGGTALIAFSLRVGLTRFLLVGALSIVLGLAVSFAWPDPRLGFSVYFAGMGCATLLSGAITLWRYVHAIPPGTEEA